MTTDWRETVKTQYNVKLLNGSKQEVTYEGVETVTLPDADSTGVKKFTAGEPLDNVTITPDFSDGDQPIEAPVGYVVRAGTVKKPEGAEAKIAKGETLMGMTGTYVTPGTSKTVELDFSESGGGETVILAETTFTTALDTTYGYFHRITGGTPFVIGETYTIAWDGTSYECTGQDASAAMQGAVCVGNGTAWGLSGNSEPFVMAWVNDGLTIVSLTDTAATEHTAKITQPTDDQTITAVGDERWNEVVINKPDTLVPENIVKDVEIAGVVGTNQGIKYGRVYRSFATQMNLLYYSSYNYNYTSGTMTIKIPSGATVLKASLSYTTSYGSSMKLINPSWLSPSAVPWPSSYISGSWRVFECTKSFSPAYNQQKYVWRGGVQYIDAAEPLYVDVNGFAGCGVLHTPSFDISRVGGYTGTGAIDCDTTIDAMTLSEYSSAVRVGAFMSIRTVTIQNGDIPSYAFCLKAGIDGDDFAELRTVIAPNAVTIGSYAFASCSYLTDVRCSNVEEIGREAFSMCDALGEVSFPRCTTISGVAFNYCPALKSCYFLGSSVPALLSSSCFYSTPIASSPPTGSIFVRASLLSSFKAAQNWSYFSSAMVGLTDEQIAELEG